MQVFRIVVVVAALISFGWMFRGCYDADKCADMGGLWNSKRSFCELSPEEPLR